MSDRKRVDFGALVDEVWQDGWGRDHLSLWGGMFEEGKLSDFLEDWDRSGMPYCIWEYVSEIVFQLKDTPPENVALLERGRLFGPKGDLELRRDGDIFRWRFVGSHDVKPPEGKYDTKDYWQVDGNQMATFHRHSERAILWGERKDGQTRWFEDRVGAAKLEYPTLAPTPANWNRVQVCYDTFSRAGTVEFVWMRELEGYDG